MYSDKLIFIRENNELTQNNVAKILDISRGSYSLYEREYTIIPLKHLITLCEHFNVSLDYIFSFTSKENYTPTNNYDTFLSGKRIKELRKECKITQKELANILNVANTIISEYENGNFLISTHALYTICKKYNVSADYLLGRIDSPKYLKN